MKIYFCFVLNYLRFQLHLYISGVVRHLWQESDKVSEYSFHHCYSLSLFQWTLPRHRAENRRNASELVPSYQTWSEPDGRRLAGQEDKGKHVNRYTRTHLDLVLVLLLHCGFFLR